MNSELMDTDELPHVLICMPTLNREWIIGYALKSILAQDYPHNLLRIVVIDGCSRDRTVDVAKEVLGSSGVNYEVIVKRSNVAQARNICIDLSRDDEVVVMWESDNLGPRKLLKAAIKALMSGEFDIVSTKVRFRRVESSEDIEKVFNEVLGIDVSSAVVKPYLRVIGAFIAAKGSTFKRLRFNESMTFIDDIDFSLRSVLSNLRIGRIDNLVMLDIDMPKMYYSDIYTDMPLTKLIKGLRFKARAYAYEITFLSAKHHLRRCILSLTYVALLTSLIITAILSVTTSISILYPILVSIALILMTLLYIRAKLRLKYPFNKALKSLMRSYIILSPMNILTLIYSLLFTTGIKYRLKDKVRKLLNRPKLVVKL